MELPLMPLNSVLFPWMPVTLSIYEQRYLDMLQHCLSSGRVFGVALIASGKEIAGPAVPHRVGTEVVIARAWPAEDGSWRVVGVGRHRFEVLRVLRQEPFPAAAVNYAGWGEDTDVPHGLVEQVQKLFRKHLDLMMQLLGIGGDRPSIPDCPARLSYMVAAHLGVTPTERQRLLEMRSCAERLRAELELLRQDVEKMRVFSVASKMAPADERLN
ncbi:MAG: LON peptidase substrate-binding domain-containing protein [Armatimonadetes bacterium]|nr:LON peptidase substrate-binding domain-containing protein [Armatimonadota bacterium]